jgi:hypothetical protein
MLLVLHGASPQLIGPETVILRPRAGMSHFVANIPRFVVGHDRPITVSSLHCQRRREKQSRERASIGEREGFAMLRMLYRAVVGVIPFKCAAGAIHLNERDAWAEVRMILLAPNQSTFAQSTYT